MARMAMTASGQPAELPGWQQLCDRGPDLVLCLDFATTPDSAGFTTLASSSLIGTRILHIRQSVFRQWNGTVDRLDAWARHRAREVLDTGRLVSAVLGYREGSTLATAVADAIAEAQRPPTVVLFDATTVIGARAALAAAAESPAHLAYLLLARQGALDTRTRTPLFLSSRDHELDHERNISLDVDRGELLTDPEVIKVVADLLTGAQSWSS